MITALLLPAALALSPEDAHAIMQIEALRLPPLALETWITSDDADARARAARALGRLRTIAAIAPRRHLAADPDPVVRREVAFALGQMEGTSTILVERMGEERDRDVRAALCEALGKQGAEDAWPLLVAALSEDPPLFRAPVVSEAAAVAIGRMAMRSPPGSLEPALTDALLKQLRRFDANPRRGAAFAIARMAPTDVVPAAADRIIQAAAEDRDPVVRAFLLRATPGLPIDEERRAALYATTARDVDEGVRTATARAAGKAGWTGVTELLTDFSTGVRLEAIAAVGQIEALDREAVLRPIIERGSDLAAAEALRSTGDPRLLEAAAALRALGAAGLVPAPGAWLDQARPTRIRAAAAAVSSDLTALVTLATTDGEGPVRTAAATRITELEPTREQVIALLSSFDPMIQAVGCEWLSTHPHADAETPVLAALASASPTDLDLVQQGMRALHALYEGARPIVRRPAPEAAPLVAGFLSHADPLVRREAAPTAAALDVEGPEFVHQPLYIPPDALAATRSARIITSRGEAIIELLPEEAPVTVWNFASLADERYFDGLIIHRVVPDFVVQDGDPRGDGWGGPGYTIPDEVSPLHYREGTVGMALSGPDTGGSQWFVTLSPQPHLDGTYTIFGRVTAGMPVIRSLQVGDRIERVIIERTPASQPAM